MPPTTRSASQAASLAGTGLTIAAGVSSATVRVTPLNDSVVEMTESVTLALGAGSGYTVGSPSSAAASILDDDRPTVSIVSTASITEGNVVLEHGQPDRDPVGTDLEHGRGRLGDSQWVRHRGLRLRGQRPARSPSRRA